MIEQPDAVARVHAVAREVFTTLGGKWVLPVLDALGDRTMRFTAVQTAVPGVSHKVLAQTLRALERDGLLTRHVHPTVPPQVDYALTDAGRAAHHTVYQLCDWSRQHLAEVLAGRDRFAHAPR
ncbi:helix-turn-helix domain-containing protein [Micromonospora sp. NPDC047812]|uniref:winged helix-turn-helix transcriptional regulator n=1 Tax=Micromonospora sp. NPDC047812 TaxID=3155742 RepID=UPI0034512638